MSTNTLLKEIYSYNKPYMIKEGKEVTESIISMSDKELAVKLMNPTEEAQHITTALRQILDMWDHSKIFTSRDKSLMLEGVDFGKRNEYQLWNKYFEYAKKCEQLAMYYRQILSDYPLVKKTFIMDELLAMSKIQDEKLTTLINSIPTSNLIVLASDLKRSYILNMYSKILDFKQAADYSLLTGQFLLDIKQAFQTDDWVLLLKFIASYIDIKRRTHANMDKEIRDMYLECSLNALGVGGIDTPRQDYREAIETSGRMIEQYKEVHSQCKKYVIDKENYK